MNVKETLKNSNVATVKPYANDTDFWRERFDPQPVFGVKSLNLYILFNMNLCH